MHDTIFLLCVIVLVAKTADDGPEQAYYIGAFDARCLLSRGATANTGVCESIDM